MTLLLPTLSACGDEQQAVPASMGTVVSTLSANGTLRFVKDASVGFPQGGRIAAINVKVGQRVQPGQPLAQVDDTDQQVALRKATLEVQIEEARLAKIIANKGVDAASDDTDGSATQLKDQKRLREEVIAADESEIDNAERQLAYDRRDLERKRDQLDEVRESCDGMLPDPGCPDRIRDAQNDVADARRRVIASQRDLDNVRHKLDVDRRSQQLAIDGARKTRLNASNTEQQRKIDRPYDIDIQRKTLEQARQDVLTARKNLQATIKPSMFSGTVSGINGKVGDILPASVSTPLPGAPADQGGLIQLTDVNAYQVTVPFSAADAEKVTMDKAVEITYPDVPGVTSQARVSDIEVPAPDAKNPNHMVTVVVDQADPKLTDGLAAKVSITTDRIDDTLVVPAAAVQVNGRTGLVTVRRDDGTEKQVSVELGMVGEKTVQVVSGIKERDQVVLPAVA